MDKLRRLVQHHEARSELYTSDAEYAQGVVTLAQDALDGLQPHHRCEPIASALMGEDRDWWVGRLLEPLAEHPHETHCLHMRTPLKDVVFLVNEADFQWLTVLARAAIGPLNETWLERVTAGACKRTETREDAG